MACVSGGSRTLTGEQVAAVVMVHITRDRTQAARWVRKSDQESDHRPECVNEIGAVGLWQVRDIHAPTLGPRLGAPTDKAGFRRWLQEPGNNAKAAKALYDEAGGWGPWNASGGTPRPTAADYAAVDGFASGAIDQAANEGVGDFVEDVVPDELATIAEAVKNAAEVVVAAGAWLAKPENMLRVALVAGGIVLVGAAVGTVAKPVVDDVAKTVSAVK